jgi:phosphohistidine phosphatase
MRLIVLRHAKSGYPQGVSDHDRPLNARGRENAPRVGQILRDLGWVPDCVLSSTAQRTRETWAGVGPALAPGLDAIWCPELYLAPPARALQTLAERGSGQTVLLLGHNPGWEQLVERLSGQPERMTTCNAALLQSAGDDWSTAAHARWTLERVVRPRPPRD